MINIEMLEEMFGGDKEITQQLFELYLAENSEVEQAVWQQYDSNDFSTLYHTMHTLSGALGNLCETDIVPDIKKIEAISKDNGKADIEIITSVVEGLKQIKEQMNTYLNQ